MCKNWCENNSCRYGDKCRFAHGQDELTEPARRIFVEKYKKKNCRLFHLTKTCMYGPRCIYNHEHRRIERLHKHYYTPQVYVLESLF